jgi:hypothetical protein
MNQSFCGQVVKRPFGVGSKSERAAVMLVTPEGDFVLRRRGGNAFADPELDRLVGKRICGEGLVQGYTLIMSQWREAPDAGAAGPAAGKPGG